MIDSIFAQIIAGGLRKFHLKGLTLKGVLIMMDEVHGCLWPNNEETRDEFTLSLALYASRIKTVRIIYTVYIVTIRQLV